MIDQRASFLDRSYTSDALTHDGKGPLSSGRALELKRVNSLLLRHYYVLACSDASAELTETEVAEMLAFASRERPQSFPETRRRFASIYAHLQRPVIQPSPRRSRSHSYDIPVGNGVVVCRAFPPRTCFKRSVSGRTEDFRFQTHAASR